MLRVARFASTIVVLCALWVAAPLVAPQPASAQPSPDNKAFILYEFEIRDPAAFKTLADEVRASLKEYKGEYVMREKVASMFGGKPTNLAVASFPTIADARAWLASPAVTKLKAEQDKVATVNTYLVEKL